MSELVVDMERQLESFALRTTLRTSGRLGILGASGSGKSMMLRCIAGIDTPTQGQIAIGGRVLFDSVRRVQLPPQKRRVGYLFQNYALFPHMTVAQNILVGLAGTTKMQQQRILAQQTARFQLEGLHPRYPAQLSGGQQQRVALSRTLACSPDILLLDEPFSALDSYLRWQLEPALLEVLEDFPGPVLYVSHNRDEVYRLCDQVAIMDQGRILRYGDKVEVFAEPRYEACARLTGCKNISPAKKVGQQLVLAIDWGLTLETAQEVPEDLAAIGLRAHDIRGARPGERNAFCLPVGKVSETPFSVTVMLGERTPLRWEVPRASWLGMQGIPEWVCLPAERLLLLRKQPEC